MSNKFHKELDNALISLAKKQRNDVYPDRIKIDSEEALKNGSVKKVAFDVYTVDNDPYENLWVLENSADDGAYLVRTSDPKYASKESGDWSAVSDYNRENITLNYKNVPIARFSSKDFGFSPDDITTFKSALLDNAKEEKFLRDILKNESLSKREALGLTFPEFKKFL